MSISVDVRLALRRLRRRPGFTTAVVASIGLSVAATTALFSILDGLLFRPLPFQNVDRIVHIELPREAGRRLTGIERQRLNDLLADTPLLQERALAESAFILDHGSGDAAGRNLRPARISPALLGLLGVRPAAGRLLDDEDARAEGRFEALWGLAGGLQLHQLTDDGLAGPGAVMLGYDLWRRWYGADPAIVGQPIELPGAFFRRRPVVVGVMPPGFGFPDGANLWIPAPPNPILFNYARLADGVEPAQVTSVLPAHRITRLREHVRPGGASALTVLLAATGLLLLIAWAQAGALLVSSAAGRIPEIGTRLALGAGPARLIVQFLIEGVLLAAAALFVAALAVSPLTTAIVRMLPEEMTRAQALSPDARAMMFAAFASVLGLVLLALAPAAIVRRTSPADLLAGRLFRTSGVRAMAARRRLVAAQLTITTALLYLSILTAQSFAAVSRVDLGFASEGLFGLRVPAPIWNLRLPLSEQRADVARQDHLAREFLEVVREIPGVAGAAFGSIPFAPQPVALNVEITLAGREDVRVDVRLNVVNPEYPQVVGLRSIAGRLPAVEDVRAGEPMALINATLARALAPYAEPVGQWVRLSQQTWRIAGVIEDFVLSDPDRPVQPQLMPVHEGLRWQQEQMVVRLDDSPAGRQAHALVAALVARTWPDRPSRLILDVSARARAAVADHRARVLLMSVISILCLPLAVAGIAGALFEVVQQGGREIGLRLALGAEARDIRWLLARSAASTLGIGLAFGLGAGVLVSRLLSAQLFGVQAMEPGSVVGSVLVLLAAGLVAFVIPARRAMRVEPARVLNEL